MRKRPKDILWYVLARMFSLCQKMGVNITPVHYESTIPVIGELPESLWDSKSEMVGVDLKEDRQLELLREFSNKFRNEYERFPAEDSGRPGEYYMNNRFFAGYDAKTLYCFVRHFKPKRVIEIGSGYSTLILVQSLLKNREENPDDDGELLIIDPYPRDFVRECSTALRSSLRETRVQDISLSEFDALGADDILFIDSSHALCIGSDVQYEILEIFPRLRPGVIIQLHDIFLPGEYPRSWVMDRVRFLNEQYLLQAFLAFNRQFEVLLAPRYIYFSRPVDLYQTLGTERENFALPVSFWLRRMPD
ncbi:MAG: class I SAM-dependent methyltransferase [Actinobacteria bacterium]|nr:class I SAM-dependent methyltransferase [Actinomycetota bacterium]